GRVPDLHRAGVAQPARLEAGPRLELLVLEARAAHPIQPEGALRLARPIPRVDVPVREPALDRVRLDQVLGGRFLALLQVVELDQPAVADALGERGDEILLSLAAVRLGRLRDGEFAARLLELLTGPVERRPRIG